MKKFPNEKLVIIGEGEQKKNRKYNNKKKFVRQYNFEKLYRKCLFLYEKIKSIRAFIFMGGSRFRNC